jgi:hypothetical protein
MELLLVDSCNLTFPSWIRVGSKIVAVDLGTMGSQDCVGETPVG